MAVLRPDHAPTTLTSIDERAALLGDAGADAVFVLPFTREVAGWSPDEFVNRILVDLLHAAAVVVGANFRFGHRAAGDVAVLTEAGALQSEGRDFITEGIASTAGRSSGPRPTCAPAWPPATWPAPPRPWAGR